MKPKNTKLPRLCKGRAVSANHPRFARLLRGSRPVFPSLESLVSCFFALNRGVACCSQQQPRRRQQQTTPAAGHSFERASERDGDRERVGMAQSWADVVDGTPSTGGRDGGWGGSQGPGPAWAQEARAPGEVAAASSCRCDIS